MTKYRILKIPESVTGIGGFQIQHSLFTIFGRTFWVSLGHPFTSLDSAKHYVSKLQTPYVEKVVWESE